jgi:hypothetical protein
MRFGIVGLLAALVTGMITVAGDVSRANAQACRKNYYREELIPPIPIAAGVLWRGPLPRPARGISTRTIVRAVRWSRHVSFGTESSGRRSELTSNIFVAMG